MNYIKEINAFYNRIIFNPLSGSAAALWHTLMHFNNVSGWMKQFSVPAITLEVVSGVKGTSFKRARDELKQKGFILVESQGGSQSAIYQMLSQIQDYDDANSFINSNKDEQRINGHVSNGMNQSVMELDQVTDDSVDDTVDHIMDHSVDENMKDNLNNNLEDSSVPLYKQINKQNNTIHKQKIITTDAINFYQENFGLVSSYISEDMINWINDIGETLVLHAMKQALEQNKANWGYVKGILRTWVKKGITTVEQVQADKMTFRNQYRQKRNQGYETRGEVVPKWFEELKQKQALEKQRKQAGPMPVPDPAAVAAEEAEFAELMAKFMNRGELSGVGG